MSKSDREVRAFKNGMDQFIHNEVAKKKIGKLLISAAKVEAITLFATLVSLKLPVPEQAVVFANVLSATSTGVLGMTWLYHAVGSEILRRINLTMRREHR